MNKEKCKYCGGKAPDCTWKPSQPQTIENWEEELGAIIDGICEPTVTKTNEHPNCEYVLSCEEIEFLEKKVKSFINSLLLHSQTEYRRELEKLEFDPNYCSMCEKNKELVINLINKI